MNHWTAKYAKRGAAGWIYDCYGPGKCPICCTYYDRLSSHYRGCLSLADIAERERLLAIEQAELFRKAKEKNSCI